MKIFNRANYSSFSGQKSLIVTEMKKISFLIWIINPILNELSVFQIIWEIFQMNRKK